MKTNEFKKDLVKDAEINVVNASISFEKITFYPKEADFSDNEFVKIIASNAVNTANGYYDLIKKNFSANKADLSPEAHIEMYLALAGLTCEIYLKSIIYNEFKHNGKKYIEHNLKNLFDKLPDIHKSRITNKIPNILEDLQTVSKVFEELRYDFELNHIDGNYFVLFDLMEELSVISNNYPKQSVSSLRYANGVLRIE